MAEQLTMARLDFDTPARVIGPIMPQGPQFSFILDGHEFEVSRSDGKMSCYDATKYSIWKINDENGTNFGEIKGCLDVRHGGAIFSVRDSAKSTFMHEDGDVRHLFGTAVGWIVLHQPPSFLWRSDHQLTEAAHHMYRRLRTQSHDPRSAFAGLKVDWHPRSGTYSVKSIFHDLL